MITRILNFKFRQLTSLTRPNIIGFTVEDIKKALADTSFEPFRAEQIYSFLYKSQGTRWVEARGLPQDLRAWLNANFCINTGRAEEVHGSGDRLTKRFLVESLEGSRMEAVIIGNADTSRSTLCVSSQSGCSLSCSFCHTGTQKLKKNLTTGEILAQLMFHPESRPGHPRPITNIVFMGQGEPLYNWRNVSKAVKLITDTRGLAYGHSKVVISTSGVAPLIPKIAEELRVGLAISLHAPNDTLRSEIMSINKTYPVASVMQACKAYLEAASSATRRISFEYVMLSGVNDSILLARELVSLLKTNFQTHEIHVNLLPFNEWPGAPYRCSARSAISAFREELELANIACTVRTPKGRDIMAACGQLSSSTQEKT